MIYLALLLLAHAIPDGKTPKEKCENQCEKQHCDDVKKTECWKTTCRPIHDKRDRCRRSCELSTMKKMRPAPTVPTLSGEPLRGN